MLIYLEMEMEANVIISLKMEVAAGSCGWCYIYFFLYTLNLMHEKMIGELLSVLVLERLVDDFVFELCSEGRCIRVLLVW